MFKKDMQVYSLRFGWGLVTKDNAGEAYPIQARFHKQHTAYTYKGYTQKGFFNKTDHTPDLYIGKPVITVPED